MPRRSKGARLYLRPGETDAGRVRKRAVWIIRDGSHRESTGCPGEDRAGAEQKLRDYLAAKYEPRRARGRHPSEILILDVLNVYLKDKAENHARPDETRQRVLTLAKWWNGRTLTEVSGQTCRQYVKWRVGQPWKSSKPDSTGNAPRLVSITAARRELEDLRSAINHHHREGLCSEIVAVALPERSESRGYDYFLTREEAARLILAAWRARQEGTERAVGKHLARFILIGLYTGTRHAAICAAAFHPAIGRGWVDLEAGVFHRRPEGARKTKKQQPPVRLNSRLLAHLRRWHRLGIARYAIVEWNGMPIKSVRKSFAAAAAASGIDRQVTPHILRHTAATWLMQNGADLWDAAGFLGMTPDMLWDVYGHHHPDFQKDVAEKLGEQLGGRLTVNKTRLARSS